MPAQDESIRLKLAISEACLLAREAKTPEAARILNESIQKATDRKWKRTQFDALLAKAEIESQAGATPSNRLLAKRLQADAGFALIARKAGALAK